MKELFKKQIENGIAVTEGILGMLKNKTYHNNDLIEIGDVVLFGFLVGEPIENDETGFDEIPMSLILINEKHFDLYVPHERATGNEEIPMIKLR